MIRIVLGLLISWQYPVIVHVDRRIDEEQKRHDKHDGLRHALPKHQHIVPVEEEQGAYHGIYWGYFLQEIHLITPFTWLFVSQILLLDIKCSTDALLINYF